MNVLVTGGAGYIGTTLIPLLLDRGYHVRVFDSLMFSGDPLLPYFRYENFEFITGDIRDREALRTVMAGQDVVIHLAAIVGFPACRRDPKLATEVNLDGSRNVVELASKDQLLLLASTGSNYGEVVDAICTEETPLNPLSHYGKTKTAAEHLFMDSGQAVVYRFATAFGLSPRMRLDLFINDFVYKALTQHYVIVYERHFMRTFINVQDIARSFLLAIDKAPQMTSEVYNVGSSDMNYSKQGVCEMIQQQVPDFYIHYADIGEDEDKRNYVVSYDKISKLGYDTTMSVEQGIAQLIKGLQVIQFKEKYSNV